MVLNSISYIPKKIRFILFQIEQESGMKLLTDLDSEFDCILFANELQHLRIDYLHKMVCTISVRITPKLRELLDDAIVYLRWLTPAEELRAINNK